MSSAAIAMDWAPTPPATTSPEVLTFGEGDVWEILRHPQHPEHYYYDRARRVITKDDIRDAGVRNRAQQVAKAAQVALMRHEPPVLVMDGDVVVCEGKAELIISWEQEVRLDFWSDNGQFVTKMTLCDFWNKVAEFPFHRPLPAHAEATLVTGINEQWHRAKQIMEQPLNAHNYKTYRELKASITSDTVGSAEWHTKNSLIAHYVAYLMVQWLESRNQLEWYM
ncbi:hypothetical protein HDZ31DRAFT_63017 [Schizophyllum fasciatum]